MPGQPRIRVLSVDEETGTDTYGPACHHSYASKLTLGVDEKVVRGAKRYAAARGTSVSRLVERYLDLLLKPPRSADRTPVLRLLRGTALGVPADAHRRRLGRKYR